MLHVEKSTRSLGTYVFFLSCGLIVLIGAAFLVTLAASIMAQNTKTASGALIAKGSTGGILTTAEAEEKVPVALAALLTTADLGRVKEIMISNLGTVSNTPDAPHTPCETCPKHMIMQVDVAMQYSESVVRFIRTGGMEITIEKGVIAVSKVPGQDPAKNFVACGKAPCSSIRINGINVEDLRKRAEALQYVHTGTRRFPGGQRRLFFLALGAPAAAKAVAVCAIAAGAYGAKKGFEYGQHEANTAAGVPTPPMSKTDQIIGKGFAKVFRL